MGKEIKETILKKNKNKNKKWGDIWYETIRSLKSAMLKKNSAHKCNPIWGALETFYCKKIFLHDLSTKPNTQKHKKNSRDNQKAWFLWLERYLKEAVFGIEEKLWKL